VSAAAGPAQYWAINRHDFFVSHNGHSRHTLLIHRRNLAA
jgi:hypothetical protein